MVGDPGQIHKNFKNKNFSFVRRKFIYVSKFYDKETVKYQELLISTINEITPCRFIAIKNKKYIKIKPLGTYDQTLIVLNFIRNLWHDPIKGYAERFFKNLELAKHEDALERLTWANKEACTGMVYGPGHSNVHRKERLRVKKTQELYQYQGDCTETFLCS